MTEIHNLGQTILIGPAGDDTGLQLTDSAGVLVDADSNTLVVTAPDGTIDTYTNVVSLSTGVYAQEHAPDAAGVHSWRWAFVVDGDTSVAQGKFVVTASPNAVVARPAFATVEDLAARLGRDLTDAEVTQAIEVLANATSDIAVAVGRTDAWAADLTPIPGGLRSLTIKVAARTLTVPIGVRGTQEQLGSYLYSTTYAAGDYGSGLTDAERRLARKIVHGTNSASVRVLSMLDDVVVSEVGS